MHEEEYLLSSVVLQSRFQVEQQERRVEVEVRAPAPAQVQVHSRPPSRPRTVQERPLLPLSSTSTRRTPATVNGFNPLPLFLQLRTCSLRIIISSLLSSSKINLFRYRRVGPRVSHYSINRSFLSMLFRLPLLPIRRCLISISINSNRIIISSTLNISRLHPPACILLLGVRFMV